MGTIDLQMDFIEEKAPELSVFTMYAPVYFMKLMGVSVAKLVKITEVWLRHPACYREERELDEGVSVVSHKMHEIQKLLGSKYTMLRNKNYNQDGYPLFAIFKKGEEKDGKFCIYNDGAVLGVTEWSGTTELPTFVQLQYVTKPDKFCKEEIQKANDAVEEKGNGHT